MIKTTPTIEVAMKYKPTPLNLACALALVYLVYLLFNPGPMAMGGTIILYLIPLIIIGILLDITLQNMFPKFMFTLIVEAVLLAILIFGYFYTNRTKTFVIPDDFQPKFVAVIYGVRSAQELPQGWNYELAIPEDGIYFTSSNYSEDLPETRMRNGKNGELNKSNSNLGWKRITHSQFECKGIDYDYQIWMVDANCCTYSNFEIDSVKVALFNEICK